MWIVNLFEREMLVCLQLVSTSSYDEIFHKRVNSWLRMLCHSPDGRHRPNHAQHGTQISFALTRALIHAWPRRTVNQLAEAQDVGVPAPLLVCFISKLRLNAALIILHTNSLHNARILHYKLIVAQQVKKLPVRVYNWHPDEHEYTLRPHSTIPSHTLPLLTREWEHGIWGGKGCETNFGGGRKAFVFQRFWRFRNSILVEVRLRERERLNLCIRLHFWEALMLQTGRSRVRYPIRRFFFF
jgi:hypothetical protein